MPVSNHEYAPKRQQPTTTQQLRRHALGLPPGSVRALLAFMVLGLSWALMCLQKELPLYLQYLMFLILGHYFASRKNTPAPSETEASPLYLPRGVIRTMIVGGFLAVAGFMIYQHIEDPKVFQWATIKQKYMPMILVIGFFAGMLMSRIGSNLVSGANGPPPWFQDIQAWLSLMAMIVLIGVILVELVINPTLEANKQIHVPAGIEGVLAAVVGYYFGARS